MSLASRAIRREPAGSSLDVYGLLACLAGCVLISCDAKDDGQFSRTDIAGLEFQHVNGATDALRMFETVGAGIALFDYDNDCDLDIYLVQGGEPSSARTASADEAVEDRLFRNRGCDQGDPCPRLDFLDVTSELGLNAGGYGMGIAVGDVDNDGHLDVFLANLGANQLWRNDRGRRFRTDLRDLDLSAASTWSTSATLFDAENDGWLDLMVVNYVDYDVDRPKICADPETGARDYCGPQSMTGVADQLLVNRRGAGWDAARLPRTPQLGKGLGVVTVDVDGDRMLDVFVANDLMENHLWMNRGGDGFEEQAELLGLARNMLGRVEASMGIAIGDVSGDSHEDLLVTHLVGETNTLYLGRPGTGFVDRTDASGAGVPSLPFTGFGTTLADFDLDGVLDLMVANGGVTRYGYRRFAGSAERNSMAQPNSLLRGLADGTFDFWPDPTITAEDDARVSRGLATGDLDNDGDLDVVITNNGDSPHVFVNRLQDDAPTPWIGLALVATSSQWEAIGARVSAEVGGRDILRVVRRTDSYLSSRDPRILIPYPDGGTVEVTWPSGARETFSDLERNHYAILRENSMSAEAPCRPAN